MLKKIFSLLIIVTMLFSVTAFASEEEVQTVVLPDSGNMEFAKALGIIGDEAIGTDTVTRLALAKMYCAVMRTDIGLSRNQGVSFTDVPSDAAPVVANVSQAGLMNGVGGGLFAPEAPVTYIQAIKTMVTFLGYAQNADDMGGYPYGYYMMAIQLGLDDNAPADMDSSITFEKAAELFKLAVNVDYREPVNFNPDTQYKVRDGLTYLEYHRNIRRVRGVIASNSVTDITGDGKTGYDQVRINGEIYTYDVGAMDISPLFAHTVDAYYDADTKEIFFAESVGNTTVVIDDSELEGLSDNYIEYYNDNGKKKKIKISDDTFVIYNGTVCANYTEADINPFPGSFKDGNITAIDNDGNGSYDVIMVDAYDTYVVSSVTETKLYTKYRGGAVLDISHYDEGQAPLLYNVIGQPIKLSEVKPGNTLSISRDKEGKITRIVVTADTAMGNIEAIESRNGKMFITMGSVTFESSNALSLNPQVANIKFNARTRLMFNKDGLVSDIEQEEYESWTIGYLTGYKQTPGLDSAHIIRVFGADSKWTVYELAEKLYINNESEYTPVEDFSDEAGMEGDLIKRQPIVFKLDGKGKVRDIHLQKTTTNTDPLYMYEGFDGTETSEISIRSGDLTFEGKLLISDDDTVIFSVPADEDRNDDKKYSIKPCNIFTTTDSTKFPFYAYGTSESPMASILVVKAVTGGGRTQPLAQMSMVVDVAETFLDEDGELAYRITGIAGSSAVEYIDKEEKLLVGPGATLPDKGDIIRLTYVESQPDIVEFAFDDETKTIYQTNGEGISTPTTNPSDAGFNAAPRYMWGKIIRTDDTTFTVRIETEGAPLIYHYPKGRFSYVKITNNGRDDIISVGSASDLVGENDFPGNGSDVLVHTASGRGRVVYIYE